MEMKDFVTCVAQVVTATVALIAITIGIYKYVDVEKIEAIPSFTGDVQTWWGVASDSNKVFWNIIVSLKNTGKVKFTVTDIIVETWLIPPEKQPTNGLIDFVEYSKSHKAIPYRAENTMTRTYLPNEESGSTYSILVDKSPGTIAYSRVSAIVKERGKSYQLVGATWQYVNGQAQTQRIPRQGNQL